jgi:putative membrane protein
MTDATAAPRPPQSDATHFHVPTWVAVTVGSLLLLAVGFVVGRATDGRHRSDAFADRAGRFGGHPGARLLALVVLVVVIALVVTAIVMLVRHFSSQGAPAAAPSPSSSAEEVLAGRLARGEIDEDEYRRRRDALRS